MSKMKQGDLVRVKDGSELQMAIGTVVVLQHGFRVRVDFAGIEQHVYDEDELEKVVLFTEERLKELLR